MTDFPRFVVVAAMSEEAAAVESLMGESRELSTPFSGGGTGEGASSSGEVRARSGLVTLSDGNVVELVLVTTGIGTAAASAVGSWALSAFAPRALVSVGSCGGLSADIAVGDVVVGARYAYSIADATVFGYAPGQVPGAPVEFGSTASAERAARIAERVRGGGLAARSGLMLSGDAFVTAPLADPMREKFPEALSADMETTAHAHVAHLLGVPFVAVRAVSDLCSPRAGEEFHIGLDVAAAHSAKALVLALEEILEL